MKRPDKCLNMVDIRAEIDRLDRETIALIGKRFEYVQAASKFKSSVAAVAAPDRFASMLTQRRAWATEEGLDPDAIETLFRNLVTHFIEEETKLFRQSQSASDDADQFPTLSTKRLVLREITHHDAPALFAIHGNAEAMKFFGNDPIPDIAAAVSMIDTFDAWRRLPNPGHRWGIQLLGSEELIGTCGLFKWNRNWRTCMIGYELHPSQQGHGYMSEAATCCIDWGFQSMVLNRIEAQIHPLNTASLVLAKRLGFIEEGRIREAGFWGGQFHDLLQFSLLKSDPATTG
jgi:[ribosomal protein S5]-alanine N-acetyltransferase